MPFYCRRSKAFVTLHSNKHPKISPMKRMMKKILPFLLGAVAGYFARPVIETKLEELEAKKG